jgi:NADP-dependent 3-hydroxy acid dehydrogenase YdfG
MSPHTGSHMRLDGKVAVITGGAQGVGLGIAQEFVDYGATVIIADINEQTLKRAAAALGPEVTTAVVDVTDLDQMHAMYNDIIAAHGRLDAVVANAGAGDSNGVQSITEKQFDFVFGVNVKGVLFTVQPAISLMKGGGTVVIIGSTASIQPPTGMSLYGGAKAALRNMVRAWIQEVKGTGIRGVDNVELIAHEGGLDGLMFGPFDLAMNLGLGDDIAHPDIEEMHNRVIQATRAAGIEYVTPNAAWESNLDATGSRIIPVGGDRAALVSTLMRLLAESSGRPMPATAIA